MYSEKELRECIRNLEDNITALSHLEPSSALQDILNLHKHLSKRVESMIIPEPESPTEDVNPDPNYNPLSTLLSYNRVPDPLESQLHERLSDMESIVNRASGKHAELTKEDYARANDILSRIQKKAEDAIWERAFEETYRDYLINKHNRG